MLSIKKGKVLIVGNNEIIISRGHRLYRYNLQDDNKSFQVTLQNGVYTLFSVNKYLRRLTRSEIFAVYEQGNKYLIIAKKGLFVYDSDNKTINKCFDIRRGSKPLNVCLLSNGHLFFGEYFQNPQKQAVSIYCSDDGARTWHVAYTFTAGNINHIHGLFFDKYTNRIWVATGDRENECIIGYTEDEFKTFEEVFRGGQEYRTCQLFFYKDFIVFGTDTQYEQNVIKKFDRKTLELTELQEVQGSVIKGGQVGDVAFISTTVEPSTVNTDKYAHLWVTKDGQHWEEHYKAKKDCLPSVFQFGTFEFPQYIVDKIDRLYFNGRALSGLDGKITHIEL